MVRNSFVLASCVVLIGALQTRGSLILSNLPGTGTYNTSGQILTATTWEAVGLTTGTSAEVFNSLSGRFDNPSPSTTTLDGGIYSNSSGNPGSLLSAFSSVSVSANITTPTAFSLHTSSSFTLQPNTTYWFILHDSVQPLAWLQDNSGGTIPTAFLGNSLVGYRNSVNSGTAWTTPASASSNYTVEINATPAPEPASLALAGLGGLALVAVARRRAV